ncbi:MAG: hypothetical protein PWR10_279 [Halanaerobiales bacterium]|nr:hypothetical protein [Halanaerobiales bacterium]
MGKVKASIFHLYHSGVAIEVERYFLVFDYYLDKPAGRKRDISGGVLSAKDFKDRDAVCVFVSHSHGDHFNPVIFEWQRANPDIKYILSADINMKLPDRGLYYFLDQDEELRIDDLDIQTFGSTDRGVSFLVRLNDLAIFHAGDLNWWHWKSFSEVELKKEEADFKREIEKIRGEKIDIAFIPVDPRLEEYYYLAGEYFAREIKPSLLVPIHFADNFQITGQFAGKLKDSSVKVAEIKHRGEKIFYKKGS